MHSGPHILVLLLYSIVLGYFFGRGGWFFLSSWDGGYKV